MADNIEEFEDLADDFDEDTGPSIEDINQMYRKDMADEAFGLLESCLRIFNNLPNTVTIDGDTYQMAVKIERLLKRHKGV